MIFEANGRNWIQCHWDEHLISMKGINSSLIISVFKVCRAIPRGTWCIVLNINSHIIWTNKSIDPVSSSHVICRSICCPPHLLRYSFHSFNDESCFPHKHRFSFVLLFDSTIKKGIPCNMASFVHSLRDHLSPHMVRINTHWYLTRVYRWIYICHWCVASSEVMQFINEHFRSTPYFICFYSKLNKL